MAGSERQRELRRRRKRRQKIAQFKATLDKATPAEKAEIARKLREMTPGAPVLIERWELSDA